MVNRELWQTGIIILILRFFLTEVGGTIVLAKNSRIRRVESRLWLTLVHLSEFRSQQICCSAKSIAWLSVSPTVCPKKQPLAISELTMKIWIGIQNWFALLASSDVIHLNLAVDSEGSIAIQDFFYLLQSILLVPS